MAACSTAPRNYSQVQEGQWQVKALVQDFKQHKSQILQFQLAAKKPSLLRADVTASLGIPLAAVTLNGDNVQLLLLREKTFYVGKKNSKYIQKTLGQSFDPQIILLTLFENAEDFSTFHCTKDEKGRLKECTDATKQISIQWTDRERDRKTVILKTALHQLQLALRGFEGKLPADPKLFELNAPNGFKTNKL